MGAIGLRRQANFTRHIESRGTDTTVNGVATAIKGLWQNAAIDSVQRYLAENEWGRDSFEIRFPAAVFDSPYDLKNGVEVINQLHNWRCVVRAINTEEQDNVITQVNALAILTPE